MTEKPSRRIFVTGVNGHIGNHIVKDLLENGYCVRGSVRDLNDPSKTDHVRAHAEALGANDRLELVQGDVLDADGWTALLADCDGLFHTATVYSTRADANTILATANMGTTHLLHAAANAGISRIVYTSSTAAVGTAPKGSLKNEDVWNSDTSLPYTTAKTQSERLAWELAGKLNLDLRAINPTAVLGGVSFVLRRALISSRMPSLENTPSSRSFPWRSSMSGTLRLLIAVPSKSTPPRVVSSWPPMQT